ncbi:hypothetical protein GOA57_30870 [Sinorhizobium meliloti]|nr:hypothetical protein [Sinorhizobium meliloti]
MIWIGFPERQSTVFRNERAQCQSVFIIALQSYNVKDLLSEVFCCQKFAALPVRVLVTDLLRKFDELQVFLRELELRGGSPVKSWHLGLRRMEGPTAVAWMAFEGMRPG